MWLNTLWLVFRKDAVLELRRRESVVSMAAFGVLSLLLYNFALPLDGDQARNLAPGLLWVSVTFTGMLGLGKAFAIERTNDVLDALVMSPAPKSAMFFGKLGANLVFIGLIELVMLPLFAAFFPLAEGVSWAQVLGVLVLGTVGLATLGTLFSAMTVSLRAREVVFPLLLLPLMVPVLISVAQALTGIIGGESEATGSWVRLLLVADGIYLIASFWVFEFLVED
jgi:heme exporter protein B